MPIANDHSAQHNSVSTTQVYDDNDIELSAFNIITPTLLMEANTTPSASFLTRSRVRHFPRIPRRRRPNDTHPISISSAVSSTARRLSSPHEDYLDPVDLCTLFAIAADSSFLTKRIEERYTYLDFYLMAQKGSGGRSFLETETFISYPNGVVYRVFDSKNTVDLNLEYTGRNCVVSQVVIRSPQTSYSLPSRDGMIFISHRPFEPEETRQFNHFSKADYEHYQETHEDRLSAWFHIADDRPIVVNVGERSGKYVLIKLLRAEHDPSSLDLHYIELVGYVGARSFAKAELC